MLISRNSLRAFTACAALAASASASAGFVYLDTNVPYSSPSISVPLNNDFGAQLSAAGVSSFLLGRSLGFTGSNAGDVFEIDFFAAEAGYRNQLYWGSSLVLDNRGNRSWAERDTAVVDAYDHRLNFTFCAIDVWRCLSNYGNDSKDWNSFQSIGLRITDDGNSAWLLWDDSGANMDDDHDDLVVRLRYRAVPEPASLALLGAGLLGVSLLRRRRRSAV